MISYYYLDYKTTNTSAAHFLRCCPYLEDKCVDELGLKDVAQWDPVQKLEQGLEGGTYQGSILRVFHYKLAELEYLGEFRTHGIFEMLGLGLCHLSAGEVKHFLTENTQKVCVSLGRLKIWDNMHRRCGQSVS